MIRIPVGVDRDWIDDAHDAGAVGCGTLFGLVARYWSVNRTDTSQDYLSTDGDNHRTMKERSATNGQRGT